ncbi:hypothetical protein HOI26_01750 [Candidatus Woesearchaeota archaeon]|jgi:hypothetical protein|nr:hypothetical protein [Candidatus Woesearchaeota archaeon]MBT5739800.1 hypothetical protein [Candidatus Woesearchaeota archaeon]
MTQALEQMLSSESVPTTGQDSMYSTIDQYAMGTAVLYSFDPPKPLEPLPQPTIKPVNPNLDGGVYIDFPKSTPNTTIIKQPLSDDVYIHHDKGPGRMG